MLNFKFIFLLSYDLDGFCSKIKLRTLVIRIRYIYKPFFCLCFQLRILCDYIWKSLLSLAKVSFLFIHACLMDKSGIFQPKFRTDLNIEKNMSNSSKQGSRQKYTKPHKKRKRNNISRWFSAPIIEKISVEFHRMKQ